ncbi:MAG TPA: bifunctional allantoicase/(S)-ureidoglycine aminohydrolase [Roseovarius sp.]
MTQNNYYVPKGGLPAQSQLLTDRAVFSEAYAVIPKGASRDIVVSLLPFWRDARFWVLARPLSGFAETFSHYIAEVQPGGGSDRPETEASVEAVLFVVEGAVSVTIGGEPHELTKGGYVYIPPDICWTLHNNGQDAAVFHWLRKAYQAIDGLDVPDALVLNENENDPVTIPETDGVLATTRFVDPTDLRHDMHVNIVTLQPGGVIPFAETHVMEHGIYVLEGKAVYHLNRDWVEVEAGDYVWLRAFCPHACYAAGPGPFRYLLYKDVNRQMTLTGKGMRP